MRTTKQDLVNCLERLNEVTDNALTPYSVNADNSVTGNVGNYHLNIDICGYQLIQIINIRGGFREISPIFRTRKDLYYYINAMILGYELKNMNHGE